MVAGELVRFGSARRPGTLGVVDPYSWPEDGPTLAERARQTWAATTAALRLGTRIDGEVIDRRPFGVFIRIRGVPDALGLAEITTLPPGADLPAIGAQVAGEVIAHAEHNYQVRLRLDAC